MSSPDIPSTSAQALARPDRPRWLPLMAKKPKEKPMYRVRFVPRKSLMFPWRIERARRFLFFSWWQDYSGGYSTPESATGQIATFVADEARKQAKIQHQKKVLLFDHKGRPIEQE